EDVAEGEEPDLVMPEEDPEAAYAALSEPRRVSIDWGAEGEAPLNEVPALGEGFDDPDYSATLPAEESSPGDLTDMDAMALGLEGRVFEDGSIAGANGYPGLSNPDDDVVAGAEHEAAEG